jgi:hypothetical protein
MNSFRRFKACLPHLYDVTSKKQTKIYPKFMHWPSWSGDGETLFFYVTDPEQAWYRFRLSDHKVEPVVSLKKIPVAADTWFAPDPNNGLTTTRDIGTTEIYALDWEAP